MPALSQPHPQAQLVHSPSRLRAAPTRAPPGPAKGEAQVPGSPGCHLVVGHAEVPVQRPRWRGGREARLGAAVRRGLRAAGRRRRGLRWRGPLLLAAEAAVHEQQAGAHGGER